MRLYALLAHASIYHIADRLGVEPDAAVTAPKAPLNTTSTTTNRTSAGGKKPRRSARPLADVEMRPASGKICALFGAGLKAAH